MDEAVIRVTSQIYYKGQRRERYIHRVTCGDHHWFDTYAKRVEWAVLVLSGVNDYTTEGQFTAWRPSMPGTDGSDRGLHYVDADPWDLHRTALGFNIVEPDPERPDEVWIKRARLESGFTAADRRRIYAALKQLAVARHWHEFQHSNTELGKLQVLETGDLPGW